MTTLSKPAAAPPAELAGDEPIRIGAEARTAAMIWKRELIRFARTRIRIVTGLAQPLVFLFVLGYGMSNLVGVTAGFDFKKFVYPGVVAMSVVSTAIFGAMSIVWDREFGFLREILIAPVSRVAIVAGKTAGSATIATAQGSIMLVLAPVIGVRLTPALVLEILGIEALMAVALTGLGVFIASRITKMESFQVVMQLLLLPMLMLSGAMFPLAGLPHWLAAITRINPLTYAIDPLRRVVFNAQNMPAAARMRFPTGVELFGHTLSTGAELGITGGFALCFLTLAVRAFGRPE